MNIVLASSSPYRKQLLTKIVEQFDCYSPDIDERQKENEGPEQLAQRLAIEKALAVSEQYPNALIIGSDQVAWLDDRQLCKPGNRENNIAQLMSCSNKTVHFYTSLCLLNSQTQTKQVCVETYTTQFRQLETKQIEYYVDTEKPFNCAGGFKMEGLGIALFERIYGDDPNSLIGLPLIQLISMLKCEGVDVLSPLT